jgi:hypothetical protein
LTKKPGYPAAPSTIRVGQERIALVVCETGARLSINAAEKLCGPLFLRKVGRQHFLPAAGADELRRGMAEEIIRLPINPALALVSS